MLDYLRALLIVRVRGERGASVVEYGLLIAGIALAGIVGFEALGFTLRTVFEQQNSMIQGP